LERARELYDGAVQSLIVLEMNIDVVRRQAAAQSNPITHELGRIQGLLREEVLKLREHMQQTKFLEVDAWPYEPVDGCSLKRRRLGFVTIRIDRLS
jgi:hypothetical protein